MQEVAEADGIQRKGLVLSMLMQLKQVCNHPAQFLHQVGEGASLDVEKETGRSGKLARLTEMLEEAVAEIEGRPETIWSPPRMELPAEALDQGVSDQYLLPAPNHQFLRNF